MDYIYLITCFYSHCFNYILNILLIFDHQLNWMIAPTVLLTNNCFKCYQYSIFDRLTLKIKCKCLFFSIKFLVNVNGSNMYMYFKFIR